MEFTMNGVEYSIKEVSQEEFNQVEEEDGYYFGQSHFFTQEIWLDKTLKADRKKKALYHELTHCYIKEYLTTRDLESFTEEILCDISANSHDVIHKIVEDYFKNYDIDKLS